MSRTIFLVTLVMSGCVVTEASINSDEQDYLSPNGTSADGVITNYLSPNGTATGARLLGVSPVAIARDGTQIKASPAGPMFGDLTGSRWTGYVTGNTTITLRIDDSRPGTTGNLDLWSYRVSTSYDGNTWHSLCADGVYAESVHGTWNRNEGVPGGGAYDASAANFTIACRGSAIPKCLEMGFKPWAGRATELAACVRAVRADYCGDGTSYTVDGTMINLYDRGGVLADGLAWIPEAEWTPAGASCVSSQPQTRFDQVAHVTPWCFPAALKPKNSCGSGFASGATIITELPAR
jgi:hypothetical protein